LSGVQVCARAADIPTVQSPHTPEPSFRVLAFLDELLAAPDLLIEYARVFAGRDDAELVVHAPAFAGSEEPLERDLAPLASLLGLDQEGSARVVVVTTEAGESVARQSAVVYTRISRNSYLSAMPQIASAHELLRLADEVAVETAAPTLALGFLDEFAEAPELLEDFARTYDGRSDTRLVLFAPEFAGAEEQLSSALEPFVSALGLDREGSADVVVLTDPAAEAELAPRASAVYSRVARSGSLAGLPRVARAHELTSLGLPPQPAAAKASPRGSVELLSVHVPKCAGNSFRAVLESVYGPDDVGFEMDDDLANPDSLFRRDFAEWSKRNSETIAATERWPRALTGHFWLGKYEQSFPDATTVVWLRDPVARLVSWFHYWRVAAQRDPNPLRVAVADGSLAIEEFVELDVVRDQISRTFLRGYALGDLDFVGIHEYFDEDLARLGEQLGWPALPVPHANPTKGTEYAGFVPGDDLVRRIRRLNPQDVDLYERALAQRGRPVPKAPAAATVDPARPAAANRPIFIIGAPRSGTSMLAHALRRHPALWGGEESDFLGPLIRDTLDAHAFGTTRGDLQWLSSQQVEPEELLRAVGVGINTLYTARSGGLRWVEQTPEYTLWAERLAEMFPDARFLFIVRDGREVAHSLLNFAANRKNLTEGAELWLRHMKAGTEFEQRYPDRVLRVDFRRFVDDPEAQLRTIYDFVGEPYEPQSLEVVNDPKRVNSSFTYKPGERVGSRWQAWSHEDRATFGRIAGDMLVELGFEADHAWVDADRPPL
jgi:hypothetical protein